MLPILYRGHEQAGFFAQALGYQPTERRLQRVTRNERSDDLRYACLIPVLDLWRMSAANAKRQNVWHYVSGMEPAVLEDVRAGRAVLVFDLSNEGPPYSPAVMEELYAWIEAERLPPGRTVWMCQNRAMAREAYAHVGPRADFVRFEHYDFFVKHTAFLFGRTENPVMGADPVAHAARMFDPAAKDSLLLCLNSTPRWHRVLTVAGLIHHGLMEDCQVSFPGPAYRSANWALEAVTSFVEANPSIQYLRPALARVQALDALKVDEFVEAGTQLVSKIDPRPYERTYFSLVTETEFTDGKCDRVTEKIVKAMCMGHPTLLIGNPHAFKFMTNLGFQDWEGVIDRRTDGVIDPAARYDAVFREVLRQTLSVRVDGAFWLDRVREVSAHNIRHAISGDLLRTYERMHDVPVVARLKAQVGL